MLKHDRDDSDRGQGPLLAVSEVRVPSVDDQDQAEALGLLPDLVLERVVENHHLSFLPSPAETAEATCSHTTMTARKCAAAILQIIGCRCVYTIQGAAGCGRKRQRVSCIRSDKPL